MEFTLPVYHEPDFSQAMFVHSPDVNTEQVIKDGVAPDNFHGTSMFPEYFKINGEWKLAEDSRMDCCVVIRENGKLEVIELRNLKIGDRVILGRTDHAEEGIFLHNSGFTVTEEIKEKFLFRAGRSRETAFSKDYDSLYHLLLHEKEFGYIVWVMGPACAFDADSRNAMSQLICNGYAHGLLAGNALATHDLEAAYFGTALGQDIYTQESKPNGHYHHIELINRVRRSGSIRKFIDENQINNGIIASCIRREIPIVLTGSIRDDGPLPEVIADVYQGQDAMRNIIRKATTVICLATQLHTIATGNMTPCFRVVNGKVRPLYIYSVDISEFALNKLSDRGSLTATSIVTNVQDFVVMVANGLQKLEEKPFQSCL
jgi:lysine-ketoglutarate reductase/saccharopine dehydrogenase-like protein (TIGR00300 family)